VCLQFGLSPGGSSVRKRLLSRKIAHKLDKCTVLTFKFLSPVFYFTLSSSLRLYLHLLLYLVRIYAISEVSYACVWSSHYFNVFGDVLRADNVIILSIDADHIGCVVRNQLGFLLHNRMPRLRLICVGLIDRHRVTPYCCVRFYILCMLKR